MKLFMKRSGAGFTLVELIVVIVILGVLAAVAVPAYSGYVDKAKEAQDLQLLGAVNTAFAAACAEHGVEPTAITAAAPLDDSGHVRGVTANFGSTANLSATPGDLNSSFQRYYGDNKDKAFQVYKGLYYNQEAGTFENAVGEVQTTYLGKDGKTYTVTVDKADIANFDASVFSSELTTKELMGEIDNVVNASAPLLKKLAGRSEAAAEEYMREQLHLTEEQIAAVENSNNGMANLLVLMTAKAAKQYTSEDILVRIDPKTGEMILDGGSESTQGLAGTAFRSTVPYALALAYANSEYAEGQTVKVGGTSQNVYTVNGHTVSNSEMREYSQKWEEIVEDPDTGDMSNTAFPVDSLGINVRYDEYNDYFVNAETGKPVFSEENKTVALVGGTDYSIKEYFDTFSSPDNMHGLNDVSALNKVVMTTSGFETYFENQGKTDLEGFMSAMTMMDSNASNMDAYDLLINGYADPSIVKMLESILGE